MTSIVLRGCYLFFLSFFLSFLFFLTLSLLPTDPILYAQPPFLPPFIYPDDLLPKDRPPKIPKEEREASKKTETEENAARVKELERAIADHQAEEEAIAREIGTISSVFKAKKAKARRLQLNLERTEKQKRQLPPEAFEEDGVTLKKHAAKTPKSGPRRSTAGKKKRDRGGGGRDLDSYDEDGDDDLGAGDDEDARPLRRSATSAVKREKKTKPPRMQLPEYPPYLVKAMELVEDLMWMPESEAFREPVNAEVLGLIDYHSIVKHPMDLSTVKQKIIDKQYPGFSNFVDDLELIHSNCVLYNTYDSPVTADCQVLQEKWTPIVERYMKVKKEKPPGSSKRGRGAQSQAAPAKKPKPLKELTWAEKETLVQHIGELPPEELAHVVQIVAESHSLSGGDVEGAEVELDVGEMSTETLRKLQEFVSSYRRSQGLDVPAPEPELEDDVQLAGEDADFKPAPAPSSKRAATGSAAPKQNARRAAQSGGGSAASAPQTHEELMMLARQTEANTEAALQELQDELKRMAGKVVERDHKVGADHDNLGGVIASAHSQYTLDPSVLAARLAQEVGSDDSSSDTVSSEDEGGPQILEPVKNDDQGGAVSIENPSGWRLDQQQEESAPVAAGGGGGGLWDEFAGKDARQAEISKQRAELEEQLRREREAKEAELRRNEQERLAKIAEEEKKRQEERERQEKEIQRKREEERLKAKMEREQLDQQVKLDDQQLSMQAFEKEMRHQKPPN